ncbi:ClC family H(+)/Cl(-) exchange transporter [Lactobacillus agrestimuris]|uniref:ClC family H(+)/Cl(-) exchange transporter n=1 Tax=Lactobacillus agrestimuris TaxID=2941328 RepID=UPI002043DBAC|nr:ClC family H(+)/Cl(-) exchange transporter [Lactobacillus agrestimuris]
MIKKANQILGQGFASKLTFTLARGIAVGLITGLVVSIFRWIIDHTMQILYNIYPQMANNPWLMIPYIILMVLITLVLGKIIGPYLNELTGSGVPQIEAIFINENKMPWWAILWRKFVGGLLSICPGLMLGREGPCIQMGSMIGQGLGEEIFHGDKEEIRILQESGVAAGLSAAFSAPLSGVFFLVEEITFEFKPHNVLSALAASFSADFVTVLFFGTTPCLYLPIRNHLPLQSYWLLPIIGIILGLLAYVYQYALLSLKPLYSKIKLIPSKYHSIIAFILIIPVGLWDAHMLGGSHVLINDLVNRSADTHINMGAWTFLMVPLIVFLIRFLFSMISYGASVPGGIFMPILVLGTSLGVLFASIFIHSNLLSPDYYPHIVVISMAAYFGAIEKAPFTAVILITEMVGSVEQVLPMIITTFVAYYVLDLLGGKPIYEALRIQMNFKPLKD